MLMDDKLSLLRSVPLFKDLSPDDLEKIGANFQQKKFRRNEIILEEKDTGNFFYLITKGIVRVVKPLDGGRERVLTLQRAGDFFGEMAVLDGRTSPARMIAQEPAEIIFLAKDDFLDIVMNHKKVNREFIQILCERLREAWGQLKTLTSLLAEQRVCKVLYDIAHRHGEKIDGGVKIMIPLRHKEIADMVATSRETVTRILLDLEHRSIIKKDNKKYIIILHPEKLMAPSEGIKSF